MRQQIPQKAFSAANSFFDVAGRIRDFNKSENPPKSWWDRYDKIIVRVCRKWSAKNLWLLQRQCMDVDDVYTYGRVYATTFWSLYRTSDPDQDCKLLTNNLQQRLWYLRKVLLTQVAKVAPEAEDVERCGLTMDY